MSAARNGAGAAPRPDEHSGAYWEAAAQGRLLIQRCGGCGGMQFYPRPFCAGCLEPDPEWVEASGRGRLHTFSVVHRSADVRFAADLPYVLAIVALEEGVQVTTRIVDADPEALRCDMPVEVAFRPGPEGFALPCFVPTERVA